MQASKKSGVFFFFLLALSSCATPLSWDEKLPPEELSTLRNSRTQFEKIGQCSLASKEDETKFNENCSGLLGGEGLHIKVRHVFVHGFKYAIVGDLAENKSITCEIDLDKKMTEEKLKTIEVGEIIEVTGPVSNYLRTSANQTAKISPCAILSGL